MTKRREQQEKEHQGRAKEKTKHDLASDAHREFAAESAPKKKSREDVNQAAARIVRESTDRE